MARSEGSAGSGGNWPTDAFATPAATTDAFLAGFDAFVEGSNSTALPSPRAGNFSRLCGISLHLLKQENALKVSIKTKRLRSGWNHDHPPRLIQQ
jgi:hypothetical protein